MSWYFSVWWTMVPASMLVGVCAAPLWTAQCSYITIISKGYARMKGHKPEAVLAFFFGIFFMMFQTSGLFSSIISATILQQAPPENYTGPSANDLALCGINDCPCNNVTNINLQKPADHLVWTLVGIFIGIAVVAFVLSLVGVDELSTSPFEDEQKNVIKESLAATVGQMKNPLQLMLIPITVFSGLEQAFKWADWSKSYVTCNIGIWMIGYTALPYYLTNAAMAFLSGYLVTIVSRIPVFITGMCIELGLIFSYIFWQPDPDYPIPFFVISGFGGIADGIWQAQINALYGFIFMSNSEAAFSNYRLWESLGFVMAFAYSSRLCTRMKIFMLMTFLFLGMTLYGIVEWKVRTRKPKAQSEEEDKHEDLNTVEA